LVFLLAPHLLVDGDDLPVGLALIDHAENAKDLDGADLAKKKKLRHFPC